MFYTAEMFYRVKKSSVRHTTFYLCLKCQDSISGLEKRLKQNVHIPPHSPQYANLTSSHFNKSVSLIKNNFKKFQVLKKAEAC